MQCGLFFKSNLHCIFYFLNKHKINSSFLHSSKLHKKCKSFFLYRSVLNKRLLIGVGEATHKVKRSIQDWVRNHRHRFQNEDRLANCTATNLAKEGITTSANLTVHGTRHANAQENYNKLIEAGEHTNVAKKIVSESLGHHRENVTNIYLAKKR